MMRLRGLVSWRKTVLFGWFCVPSALSLGACSGNSADQGSPVAATGTGGAGGVVAANGGGGAGGLGLAGSVPSNDFATLFATTYCDSIAPCCQRAGYDSSSCRATLETSATSQANQIK